MQVKKLRYMTTNDLTYIFITIYFLLYYCVSGTIFSYRSIVLAITAFAIFFLEVIIKKKRITRDKVGISILIIYILIILSSLVNSDGFLLQTVIRFFQIIPLYLGIVSYCDNDDKFIGILNVIFWTGFIGGPIAGLYQMITGSYIYPLPIGSPYEVNVFIQTVISSAVTYNPNLVALQFLPTFFIGIYLYNKTQQKVWMFTTLIVCATSILLTFSRTTILATIFGCILYKVIKKHKINSLKFFTLYFGLLLAFILLYFMSNQIIEDILHYKGVEDVFKMKSAENVDIRFSQWIGVKEILFSSGILHLIFGYGENYTNILGNITGYKISAHNTLLEQLMKSGLFNFFLLIYSYYFSLKFFWKSRRTGKDNSAFLVGIIAVIISVQMVAAFTLDSVIYLIIASVLSKMMKEESKVNA